MLTVQFILLVAVLNPILFLLHVLLQCGIVTWKTFTAQTGGEFTHSFDVQFNKTRRNTVLRIAYTSTFGMHAADGGGYCFTVSVKINGEECADPAPIKSGAVAMQNGSPGFSTTVSPGSVSGVCNVSTRGMLRISMHTDTHCHTSSSAKYVGYYPGRAGRPITATLNAEEMCPGSP